MNCKHCDKEIVNAGGLATHEPFCKKNPNRVVRSRVSTAGAKKGSIPWNKNCKTGRLKHWDEKFPLATVLVENSTYARHCLKKRILDNELIVYKCGCCGIDPVWYGEPMPLILDHINGVNDDNRLINLRFVCSNCDSQLPTYKSKNRKK